MHRDGSPDEDDHFDAVVIGSGFGGSVAAFRLAEGGKSVCVLERGRRYPPGSFARTPAEMRHNFWRPSKGSYGLFDVWSFRHIEAIVSAGLGGGSLIYANVLIRKDENWFVTDGIRGKGSEPWPITRAKLESHYDNVERILSPQIFPEQFVPHSKTEAMREAAFRMGISETNYYGGDPTLPQWYRPQLAVTFANPNRAPEPGVPITGGEPNLHGKPRTTCHLCGECDVGCNYGSKNTLDYTYLSKALKANPNTRICDLTEVEWIERDRRYGRPVFRISYVKHDIHAARKGRVRHVTAERVVVACGTLGSTLLLLRNRENLSGLSRTLGSRFSGNGDYLAFARDCTHERPGTKRRVPVQLRASRSPVITSTFRFPDAHDAGAGNERGRYLQDAGYPLIVDYVWEMLEPIGGIRRLLSFVSRRLWRRVTGLGTSQVGGQMEDLIGKAKASVSSMPLLGMGRDTPDGVMSLDWRHRLRVSWRSAASHPYFGQINRSAATVARKLGGKYWQNPITSLFNRLITVHPLGGCPMGLDARSGVVDEFGEVFGCPGLYVVDGAAMPGPVGANPSMTIAAFADRAAEAMLERWR
jgi:cholesterol oxidase